MKADFSTEPNGFKIAINFDLSVKECKAVFGGSRSKAYRVIKKDLTEHGFIHDQGSGYVSEKALLQSEILATFKGIFVRNEWLTQCCKRLRVTPIVEDLFDGEAHADLIKFLSAAAATENSNKKKPVKRQKTALEQRYEASRDKLLSELDLRDIPPEKRDEVRAKITEELIKRTPPRREFDEQARRLKSAKPAKTEDKTSKESGRSPRGKGGGDGASR